MSTTLRTSRPDVTPPLGHRLDEAFLRQPYIHIGSRASYRHWWEQQVKDAWHSWGSPFTGRHEASPSEMVRTLYPHLFPKPEPRRYRYSRNPEWDRKRPWVSHTVVLPDGEQIEHTWQNPHGRCWRRSSDCTFRVGFNKGVSEPGRVADSIEREEKTKDFRNSKKGFNGGSRKTYCKRMDNRKDRRAVREALRDGRYDEVRTSADPVNKWAWD